MFDSFELFKFQSISNENYNFILNIYLKHMYYVLYSTCVKCNHNYCIQMSAFEIVNYIYVLYHFICNIIGLLKCKFNSCSLCMEGLS